MSLNPRPIRPWFQINEEPPIHLLRFAGVHTVLSPEPKSGFSAIDNSPIYSATVPNPMPRAWLATAPRPSPDSTQAIHSLLSDPNPMARPTVVKLPGDWPENGEVQPIKNLERRLNQVSFRTASQVDSVAVLTDSWHPGWSVTVDGTPAEALQIAGVFRGVVLPAGSHDVLWKFEPWGWKWGLILWWGGLFMALFLVWFPRTRGNKQPQPVGPKSSSTE